MTAVDTLQKMHPSPYVLSSLIVPKVFVYLTLFLTWEKFYLETTNVRAREASRLPRGVHVRCQNASRLRQYSSCPLLTCSKGQ